MTRYFFNLHDGKVSIDDHGTELPDLAAARDFARHAIRDTAGHQIFDGSLHLSMRIEIADDTGSVVSTVRLAEAVDIVD